VKVSPRERVNPIAIPPNARPRPTNPGPSSREKDVLGTGTA
jgi:hypothetical protein